ncbi:MAG: hypothetical protein AAFY88_25100 [Acidobacteriota bacterium]
MRYVNPSNAGKVLGRDIYWTVPFLDLFLERCDALAFEVPADAVKVARHAPSLVELIDVGGREGEFSSHAAKRSYRVFALAVQASTFRRIGQLSEAQRLYRMAFGICKEGVLYPRFEAELHYRYGNLLAKSGAAESLEHFERALLLFEHAGDRVGMAHVLVLRAGWHWLTQDIKRSAEDLGQALIESSSDSTPRAQRAMHAALGNLMRLESRMTVTAAADAVEWVRKARLSIAGTTLFKANLFWLEGSLCRRLQFLPQSIRLLKRAWAAFARLEAPVELAEVALELAITMIEAGEREDALTVREQTLEALPTLSQDPLLLDAMQLWQVHVRRDALAEIRQRISAPSAG